MSITATPQLAAPYVGETSLPNLTPRAKEVLQAFYSGWGLSFDSPVNDKLVKLGIELGGSRGAFFAYGGEETPEMELRSLEFMYLLDRGVEDPIEV